MFEIFAWTMTEAIHWWSQYLATNFVSTLCDCGANKVTVCTCTISVFYINVPLWFLWLFMTVFLVAYCMWNQNASSATAWQLIFHGDTGLWCHCRVSTLLGIGLQVTSEKHISQYLLTGAQRLREREMRRREKKNIKYVPFLRRDLSACKLTLIISWHLKHVIFQIRPYSYVCQERLGSCG